MLKSNQCFVAEAQSNVLKIRLNGEIDHHSAVATRTEIDSMIFRNRPQVLEMDLSEVDFMDSSGLGLIMGRYSIMNDLGGKVTVVNPSDRVEKIIRLAGLDKIIKIEKRRRVNK